VQKTSDLEAESNKLDQKMVPLLKEGTGSRLLVVFESFFMAQ